MKKIIFYLLICLGIFNSGANLYSRNDKLVFKKAVSHINSAMHYLRVAHNNRRKVAYTVKFFKQAMVFLNLAFLDLQKIQKSFKRARRTSFRDKVLTKAKAMSEQVHRVYYGISKHVNYNFKRRNRKHTKYWIRGMNKHLNLALKAYNK